VEGEGPYFQGDGYDYSNVRFPSPERRESRRVFENPAGSSPSIERLYSPLSCQRGARTIAKILLLKEVYTRGYLNTHLGGGFFQKRDNRNVSDGREKSASPVLLHYKPSGVFGPDVIRRKKKSG